MTSLPAASTVPRGTRALRALVEFFRLEATGGLMLIGAAVLAMALANSPLRDAYEAARAHPMGATFDGHRYHLSALLWINDGLMAVFFLLVALEIKREALSGQLARREQRVLPLVCAAAGVALPALLFSLFNRGEAAAMRGWAVPTATDIAFALGVLALLGPRVPTGMKLLLSTIAVVDDLIAILIIAIFYSQGVSLPALAAAAATIAAMWMLNRRGVTSLIPYLLLGAVLWLFVLRSGVHATLAGVATGLMIPHVDPRNDVDDETEHSPLESLEHALHPWVAYAILPLFALANAGLSLRGIGVEGLRASLPLGIIVALVVGKPVAIVGAGLVMRALRVAVLPEGMDVRMLIGLGMLCGIGFTMSLFVALLAYGDSLRHEGAVLGVLTASLLSALLGYAWLRPALRATEAG